jgi:hypothetical protein
MTPHFLMLALAFAARQKGRMTQDPPRKFDRLVAPGDTRYTVPKTSKRRLLEPRPQKLYIP